MKVSTTFYFLSEYFQNGKESISIQPQSQQNESVILSCSVIWHSPAGKLDSDDGIGRVQAEQASRYRAV